MNFILYILVGCLTEKIKVFTLIVLTSEQIKTDLSKGGKRDIVVLLLVLYNADYVYTI